MNRYSTSKGHATVPFLRFASGVSRRPGREEFLRLMAERRFEEALELVDDGLAFGAFRSFNAEMMRWSVALARSDFGTAHAHIEKGRREASSAFELAVCYENAAATCFVAGDFRACVDQSRLGLAQWPAMDGLWVNLAAGLLRLGALDELDAVIERLPRILAFRDDAGPRPIIALLDDPDLEGLREREAFRNHILPLLKGV